MNNILAVDPGTDNVGLAYRLSNGKFCLCTLTSNFYGIKRLEDLTNKVMHTIEGLRPTHVVFEDYAFSSGYFNVEVAEIVGAIKYRLHSLKLKCDVTFLAPNTVKFLIAGSGKATKPELRKAISKRYCMVNITTSHESDALSIFAVMEDFLDGKLNGSVKRKIQGRTYSNV